jgi:multiple sugar transport system substrate-binding protein
MFKPNRFLVPFGLVVGVILAACAPAPTPAPTAAPPTSAPVATSVPASTAVSAATSAPSATAAPKLQGNLRFANWQWGEPGFGDFYKAAEKAFVAANPGVTIEEYALPVNQYFDKMLTDVQSGSPADLMMLRGSNYAQFQSMGALTALDDRFAKTDILSRWDPAQSTVLKIDGKTYGLLMLTRNYQIIYNKKAFAAAGITKFPTTPDEFLAAATKLTRKTSTGEQYYGYSFATTQKDFGFYEDIVLWANCFGGNFAKEGKITATDPNTIKGLTFMKSMFDAGVMPKGLEFSETQTRLANGSLAMLHGQPGVYSFVQQQAPDKLADIDFGGMPCPNHTSTGGPQNVLVIPAKGKNPDLAFEFMKFLASPEWQRKFPDMTFSLPGMQNALSPDFQTKYPWFKVFSDAQPYTIIIAPSGFEIYQSEWQKIVGDRVEAMFYTNKPSDQTAQDVQKALSDFVASKK